MTERDWEGELRQVIVLADMQGADKQTIAAAFDRGLREAHSERKPLIRWPLAVAGWMIFIGIAVHVFAILTFVVWATGVL